MDFTRNKVNIPFSQYIIREDIWKIHQLTLCALALSLSVQAQAVTHAVIETNMGNIQLELDEVKAPKTVANFVNYAKKGFYDNTIFHRVIDNFMIQGGGFTEKMVQKSTDKAINNEADNGLKNNVGTMPWRAPAIRIPQPASSLSIYGRQRLFDFKSKTPQGYGLCRFSVKLLPAWTFVP